MEIRIRAPEGALPLLVEHAGFPIFPSTLYLWNAVDHVVAQTDMPESQGELFTYTGKPTNEIRLSSPLLSCSLPLMKSPKPKRIPYVYAGVLMIDQVKSAILKGTDVRFDLSKGKGIK